MPSIIFIAFFVVFTGMCVAAYVGFKFYESRRRRQVSQILSSVSGGTPVVETRILKEAPGEEQKPLERLLSRFNLEAMIKQAGLDWKPQRLLMMMAACGAVCALAAGVLLWQGPGVLRCLVAGCLGTALPYLYVARKRSRRLAVFEEQFSEALEFLARSMRAGHAFSISLEMLSDELPDPVGIEFRTLFNEQNLGAPLEVALRNLTERVPLLDVRFFTSAVMMQRQTGGNLAEVLTRLAQVIRQRFQLKGQVRAASAHGRMTAGILTVMPVATMLGLLLVAPGYLEGMAADKDGRYLIVGCIIAQVIGNLIIRKIIRIKV